MRFLFEQRFGASVDEVARAFSEPGLYELMGQLPKLGRPQLLERSVDGDLVHLSVRYWFTGTLSPAARAVLDPDKLSWVAHTTHDLTRHSVDFRMAPDHYADRLSSSGRSTLRAVDGGARRVTEGDVAVRVRFVGGPVERAIVSGIGDHLADQRSLVERWLAETA